MGLVRVGTLLLLLQLCVLCYSSHLKSTVSHNTGAPRKHPHANSDPRQLRHDNDFVNLHLETLSNTLGGSDVSALEGAEIVGDDDAFFSASNVGDESVVVGHIEVDGEEVPIHAYSGDGDDENITIVGVGDMVVGNLSTSRKLIRALTCGQVAHAANTEDEAKVCDFVKQQCKPAGGIINYLVLPYCYLNFFPWAGGIFLLLWMGVLFIWLTAAVEFLVPALNVVSDYWNLSSTVAGVTVLAFGNGAADIFSMLAATLSGPFGMELAVGEVLGNGMFCFCAVQGAVALIAPFRVCRREYFRDCGFYLLSVFLTFMILRDGEVSFMEGVLFIGTYVLYVLVVISYDTILYAMGALPVSRFPSVGPMQGGDPHAEEGRAKAEAYEQLLDSSDSRLSLTLGHLNPFQKQQEQPADAEGTQPWFEVVYGVIASPILVLLKLTVPTVDMRLPNDGWIRPVVLVQLSLFPTFLASCVLLLEGMPREWYEFRALAFIYFIAIVSGLLLGFSVFRSSEDRRPPSFHRLLGFVAFAAALMWIYLIAREIVNAVLAFGTVFEVGSLVLGVTILAIGIGMQDLVTCVGVARSGMPNMAAGACIGGSLMNILLGLGVCAMAGNSSVESPYRLYMSLQLLCCLAFMMASVLAGLICLAVNDWVAERVFGGVLIGMYVLFSLSSVGIDQLGEAVSNSPLALHAVSR